MNDSKNDSGGETMDSAKSETSITHSLNPEAAYQDSEQNIGKLRQYFRLKFESFAACRLYRMHGIEYQQKHKTDDGLKQK